MQATASVVIIGAGAIGCSTAYHLVKDGVRGVVVLEKDQVGAGSSSKSAAMLSMQFCRDEVTARLAQRSYERYMAFEEEIGVSIDFRKIGWLYVATEECATELQQQATLLQTLGITTEVLQPADVKHLYPELNTEDVVLGTWGPDDGPLDVHMILSGYIKRARELGARLYEGVQVLDILLERGKVAGMLTDLGVIATDCVINAAGPWAAQVGRWVGVSIPLLNSNRSIIVTSPIATIPSDRPFVEDLCTEWYFRPELDGVLMGMGVKPVENLDANLDETQVAAIIERAVHRVPALESATLLSAWTGVRPLTPDNHAIVGAVPEVEGFLLNCGWGGVGIIMAPVAGQMIVDYILGKGVKGPESDAFNPARFDGAMMHRI